MTILLLNCLFLFMSKAFSPVKPPKYKNNICAGIVFGRLINNRFSKIEY